MSPEDERARFRAMVKSTHPDAGGDHEAFVAAMAGATRRSPGGSAFVRFYHRPTRIDVTVGALRSAAVRVRSATVLNLGRIGAGPSTRRKP